MLPARTAENAGSVAYDDPQLSDLQKNAYPDLAPIKAALSWSEAFDRALYVAKTMPGWTVVASDPDAGRIEASQRSRWFGFTDEGLLAARLEAASTCAPPVAKGEVIMASMPRASVPTWLRSRSVSANAIGVSVFHIQAAATGVDGR